MGLVKDLIKDVIKKMIAGHDSRARDPRTQETEAEGWLRAEDSSELCGKFQAGQPT